jgi:hypothetical protein
VGAIGPEFFFWFMLLYDFFFWLGTVDCRDGVSVCSETNV